jgi:hypothetical protein
MIFTPQQSRPVVAQLVETLLYSLGGRGFDSLEFFIDIILRAELRPGVESAFNRIFPGG